MVMEQEYNVHASVRPKFRFWSTFDLFMAHQRIGLPSLIDISHQKLTDYDKLFILGHKLLTL